MQRTMFNLAFIEGEKTPDGPFEVTQLVNSFLGALAHPWEKYCTDLDELPLAKASELGWPELCKEQDTDEEPKSLGEMLRLVRNGFAHGHLEYIPDSSGDIGRIRFWNENPKRKGGKRTWGSVLTVEDLRRFLECFVALADEIGRPKARVEGGTTNHVHSRANDEN
jgi:hypothetical protein